MTFKSLLRKTAKAKQIKFSLLVLLVSLLFTFLLWDRYLQSDVPLDRDVASHLVLLMGSLFSLSAGLFAWSLERRHAYLESEVLKRTAELQNRNDELEKAMHEIKKLQGFLPICSNCKKIRDDKGYWQQIEAYLQQHSEAKFSHTLCQDCLKEFYPNYVGEKYPDIAGMTGA